MADHDATIDLGIRGLGPAEHIGRGGFADVYKAEQLSLRRTVAVKVLRAQASDAETEARFERECHAIGAVSDHPHIVGVHEGGFTSNGRAYLVMEYLPGGSLKERLDEQGPLPGPEAVDIIIKIGRALAEAHRAGILHRDVKPANIMISAYGEPALGDFGIARIEGGHRTATGLVTASFAHAAPEVLEGQPPTEAADIYSLGTTMFELLLGRGPYYKPDDETIWPLMKRILSEPMPTPESVGMAPELGSVLELSTARNPVNRYRTADAMAHDLVALAVDPAAATIPSSGDPTARRSPETTASQSADTLTDRAQAAGPGSGNWSPVAPAASSPDLFDAGPDVGSISGMPADLGSSLGADLGADFGAELGTWAELYEAPKSAATQWNRAVDRTLGRRVDSVGDVPKDVAEDTPEDTVLDPVRRGARSADSTTLPAAGQASGTEADTAIGGWAGRTAELARRRKAMSTRALGMVMVGLGGVSALAIAAIWLLSSMGGDGDRSALSASLARAETGPLEAGTDHQIEVPGAPEGAMFRAVVDGLAIGAPALEFPTLTVEPGRHVLAVEVTVGDRVQTTDQIDVYGMDATPVVGYQANLASVDVDLQGWVFALQVYDRLVADGHEDVRLVRSDAYSAQAPGYWNLFVPGFGADAGAAEAYCERFGLEVPSNCYAGYLEPAA